MGLFKSIAKLAGPVMSVAGVATGQPWLTAAGQAVGGIAGASAAKKASNAQVAAAQQASDLQREMYYKNLEQQAPFREAGLTAQNKLLDYMGLSAGAGGKYARDFSMADFQQDPGYAFRLSEGMKGLNATAAARGGLISGNALRAATQYGQDMGSQEYQNAYNRYQTNRSNQLNPLQSLMGASQTATNTMGAAGQNYANQAGEAYMGAGNARASGYVGSANAWNSALGSAANTLSQNSLMNRMFPQGGGNSFIDPATYGGTAMPGVSYFGNSGTPGVKLNMPISWGSVGGGYG
jgi:hypothetical protein